ncbi:phosphoribosylglycinamide formyltransferase-1 [Verrucomicrobium sp. GAS474]|uniref:phosphoribosylglycinamide formyltransferase n=1 Tax=Verrucomicrobium sp. GAS474 TaxID=1882831 RepID=UPI00087B1735|nr:phosphoribosylglycinamide formyltransferase [Verrucomicrobium sp. GAS474]SDT86365.1 phosphoribosylglycinamide formyltransferase-1 [Verrucomicrobium sp. GAS474]
MLKLAVLGSGKGSNFVAIQNAIVSSGGILADKARVVLVASDNAGAGILDHARAFGLPAEALPKGAFKTKLEPEIEQTLASLIRRSGADLVVLAGYMRVVKAPLLDAFPERIINIHPSILPAFKGLEAWKQALAAGVAETGCTVHWVNAEIDGGDVLGQERVPILPGDTAETLHARIHEAEHRLYPAVIARLAVELGKA